MIVGFDVGGTNARGLLIDPRTGSVVGRRRESSAGTGSVLRDTLAAMVDDFRAAHRVAVDAIGLGIAGLAARSGTIHYSPNLPDLVEYPLGPELAAATRVERVEVMNEASAAAMAEAKIGAGRESSDFVYVALGTGIGAGFVSGGQLVLGAHGFAGEAGHMQVQIDGPLHHTGQRGPWEYFASGTALGRLGREAADLGRFPGGIDAAGSAAAITGETVAAAVQHGDPEAGAILDDFAREVARGVANLVLLLDPSLVILGGGLVEVGEPLREGVDRWLGQLVLGADHRPDVEVALAETGVDAAAIGAALLAAEGI